MDRDPLDFLLSPGPVEPAPEKTAAELKEKETIAKTKYFVERAWAAARESEARWSAAEARWAAASIASAPAAPVRSAAAQARLAAHIEADRLFRLARSK